MTEYAIEHLAISDLFDETGDSRAARPTFPDIAMAQVTFYFGGQRFVDELRKAAGGGWDLVDFAYQRRLPATTEQILHPEKYLKDEDALSVPDSPGPGPGWAEVDKGTVGEFFTRELLRQDADKMAPMRLPPGGVATATGSSGARARLPNVRTTAARITRSRSSGAATTRWSARTSHRAPGIPGGLAWRRRLSGITGVGGSRVWDLEVGGSAAIAGERTRQPCAGAYRVAGSASGARDRAHRSSSPAVTTSQKALAAFLASRGPCTS